MSNKLELIRNELNTKGPHAGKKATLSYKTFSLSAPGPFTPTSHFLHASETQNNTVSARPIAI